MLGESEENVTPHATNIGLGHTPIWLSVPVIKIFID
jgi:hypothetical protein